MAVYAPEVETRVTRGLPRDYRREDDISLVVMARRKDAAAFEELMRRYKGLIRAKGRTYYIQGASDEDVIQEGGIGLFKAVRDFNGHGDFRGFADLCVTRHMITATKAGSRKKQRPLNTYVSLELSCGENDDSYLIDTLPDTRAMDPQAIVAEAYFMSNVRRRMTMRSTTGCTQDGAACLSDLEARAIALYLQGMSYGEIAGVLRRKIKDVDNALQRAKRKISGKDGEGRKVRPSWLEVC